MKTIHLLFAILCASGCATQKPDKDVLTVFDLATKVTHENTDYYVVDVNDLKRVNKPASVTYVGTVDSFHLFREWSKLQIKEGEIFSFALAKSSCEVRDEATPENEHDYYESAFKQWRHVSLENGKCHVPPRKSPPNDTK